MDSLHETKSFFKRNEIIMVMEDNFEKRLKTGLHVFFRITTLKYHNFFHLF